MPRPPSRYERNGTIRIPLNDGWFLRIEDVVQGTEDGLYVGLCAGPMAAPEHAVYLPRDTIRHVAQQLCVIGGVDRDESTE